MIGWIRRRTGKSPDEETGKLKAEAERRQARLRAELVKVIKIREARRGA